VKQKVLPRPRPSDSTQIRVVTVDPNESRQTAGNGLFLIECIVMERLGIVDLGSNTARLVVYGYEPERWFRLVSEIREPVRLGAGMGADNRLAAAAIERAAAALRLFADFAAASELSPPRVLATSALRDAVNRERFFERVRPLGLRIDVLSGEEEAALGVLAVANSHAFDDAWVIDLEAARRSRRCAGAPRPAGAPIPWGPCASPRRISPAIRRAARRSKRSRRTSPPTSVRSRPRSGKIRHRWSRWAVRSATWRARCRSRRAIPSAASTVISSNAGRSRK